MPEEEVKEIKLSPKSEIENLGPCKLKVKIQIESDKVDTVIENKYKLLNESVTLPGFRRGHAPRVLLEKKFGRDLLKEIKQKLIEDAFKEVKEEKKLEPLIEPRLLDEEAIEVKHNTAFVYSLEIETKPDIQLKAYKKIKIKRPKVEVKDKDIKQALESLRDQRAQWQPSDQKVSSGDMIICDQKIFDETKVVLQQENAELFASENITIGNFPLKELHKNLLDKSKGDEISIQIKLPDNFIKKDIANKEVTLALKIKSIKKKILPEVNDDFAKSFNVASLEEMKKRLHEDIMKNKEDQAKEKMAGQIIDHLMKENQFDLPEGLIKKWTDEHLMRLALDMVMQGTLEDKIKETVEARRQEAEKQSTISLKEFLIIEHIANKEKIFVTEDEINGRVQQIAASQGKWPHEVMAYLEENNLIGSLRRQMRTEKVLDFLISNSLIEEE